MARFLPLDLQPFGMAGLEPNLSRFITILMPGARGPNIERVIQVVEQTDGLSIEREAALRTIYHAVLWSCMAAEIERKKVSFRRTAREINGKRIAHLAKMKAFRRDLGNDRLIFSGALDYHKVGEPLEQQGDYLEASRKLDDAIVALEKFTEKQSEILTDRGGNSKAFEIAFVHAVRACWHAITGKSPGVRKSPLVNFAVAIWEEFDFICNNERPLYDWLSERLDNIR